jgi:multidrug resistance protein MdtO
MTSDVSASYQAMFTIFGQSRDHSTIRHAALPDGTRAEPRSVGIIPKALTNQQTDLATEDADPGVRQTLSPSRNTERAHYVASSRDRFFKNDALANPEYQRFALKTTAAAMFCYIFYAALDWQGIHTAMITCYVASLGTTGETIHKLILRILGCLVGAIMGWGTIIFLMPFMDDVGHLMLAIFCATFVAAWVSTGSSRISYAGLQIGLAYLLSLLHGFGPSLDLEVARDRLVGILVGNIAIFVVSTCIWPVGVEHEIRLQLARALHRLAQLADVPADTRNARIADIAEIETALGKIEEAVSLSRFEPRQLRLTPVTLRHVQRASISIERLSHHVYLSRECDHALSSQLSHLARNVSGVDLAVLARCLQTRSADTQRQTKCEERCTVPANSLRIAVFAAP